MQNQNKSVLRADFLKQLNTLTLTEKLQKSEAIQNSLKSKIQTLNITSINKIFWGAFQPLLNEPQIKWSDVSSVIEWCFPVVSDHQLVFKSQAHHYQTSKIGVSEPQDGETVEIEKLQGVVVPGLGFSQQGIRLGRGKGFYDRTLAEFKGHKIGVCFDLTFQPELPAEKHDLIFNQIVTESSIYQVGHSEGEASWS